MNFEFTESEKMIRESVGSFLAEKTSINAKLAAEESPGGFDRAVWSEIAELGWFDAVWARDADDIHTLGIIAMEIGRASYASPFIASAAAAILLDRSGGAQDSALAKGVAAGKTQLAIIHPRVFKSPLKLEGDRGGHTLSSGRGLVGWAETADFLVVPVHTNDGDAVALIDRKSAGVTIEPAETFDNASSALVQFTNVQIPAEKLFAIGTTALAEALDLGDLLIAAEGVGGAFGALDLTAAYVKERVQFGKAIATFQAVRHGLADVKSLAEGAWLAVWDGLSRAANSEPLGGSVALAKWLTKTAFQEAAIKGSQYHGGMGHTRDSHMQFYYCRAGSLHGRLDSEWNILKQLAEHYVEPNFERITD